MSAVKRHHFLPLGLAASLGLMALGVTAAEAHTHPTPIERAAPAVVFIEARANVEVALIEHHTGPEKRAVHISIIQSTWNPLLDTASGFFADPNGTVVTTGGLLTPRLREAEVFAVNHAFAQHYGAQAPLPPDPFSTHHVGARGNTVDQRLQACYPPHKVPNDAGGCVIRTTMAYTVHPYVTDQRLYGNLPAEVDLKHSTTSVALLRVRSNNLPTVTIAPPSPQETALAVLGFVDIPGPTGTHRQQVVNQHFAKPGGPLLKSANLDAAEAAGSAMLKKELGHGIEGGPVVAGGGKASSAGQVVGLIPGPAQPGQPVPTLVDAATILGALRSAGVANRSSVTDQQFELAMHHFKNKEYTASVPYLENTLKQFPGHALAVADLAVAKDQVKKGAGMPATTSTATPGASSGARGSSSGWLLVTGLVVTALAVLLAVVLALRQRRRGRNVDDVAQASGAGTPAPSGAPGTGAAGARGDPPPVRRPAAAPSKAGAPNSTAGTAPPGARDPHAAVGPAPAATRPPGLQPSTQRPGPDRGAGGRPSAVQRAAADRPSSVHRASPGAASSTSATGPDVARFCTSCGGRLAAGHRFCGRCGAPVGRYGDP